MFSNGKCIKNKINERLMKTKGLFNKIRMFGLFVQKIKHLKIFVLNSEEFYRLIIKYYT